MPAAAMMPACRMPLPNILRKRLARTMKSREPHTAADLGVEDVAVDVEHDLLAGLRVRAHRHEIALRARRDEETGLFAQALGGERFQPPDGGVFLPHVVADLGASHRVPHRGR